MTNTLIIEKIVTTSNSYSFSILTHCEQGMLEEMQLMCSVPVSKQMLVVFDLKLLAAVKILKFFFYL